METSGKKYDDGKLEWDMIPFEILEDLVRIYMMGRDKYDKNDWKKGIVVSRLFNAAMRHMLASWNGEDLDPESKLPHNMHAVWNLIAIEWMKKNRPDMDDRDLIPDDQKILVSRDSNIDFASQGITDKDITHYEKQLYKVLDLDNNLTQSIINDIKNSSDHEPILSYLNRVGKKKEK